MKTQKNFTKVRSKQDYPLPPHPHNKYILEVLAIAMGQLKKLKGIHVWKEDKLPL